jgi:hypothetical protein
MMSPSANPSTKYKPGMLTILLAIAGFLVLFGVLALRVAYTRMVLSEQAVAHFHQQLNAGQYSEIYEQSMEDLKESMSETEFTRRLEKIRRAHGPAGVLGDAGETRQKAIKIGFRLFGGVYITLWQETNYTLGEAQETFVFATSGGNARLSTYNINSPELRAYSAAELDRSLRSKIDIKEIKWTIQPIETVQPAK